MKRITFTVTVISISIILACCRTDGNSNNGPITDSLWNPSDSLRFYFPQGDNADSGFLTTWSDDFQEKWYSSALFAFREPILYDKKLSADAYRFLWLRSFHRPVVFTMIRSGDEVTFTSKILDAQPEFVEARYTPADWPHYEEEFKGKTIEKAGDSIIVKADWRANIVYNITKKLTSKNWNAFEQLLEKADFWNMPATANDRIGMDGSDWIIEAHAKGRYWFVVRWSPTDEFQKAGIYLIKLSGLKEEIY